jgi:hypothetical protein
MASRLVGRWLMNQPNVATNWVRARSQCSPVEAFRELEQQIKADVETRNSLRTVLETRYEVNFVFHPGEEAFQVSIWRGGIQLERVIFGRVPGGISVDYTNAGRPGITGILTLSKGGECLLRVKGLEEHSFWQFRKLALEDIFFAFPGDLRR